MPTQTIIRRIHGLEALRLIGWDLPLWGSDGYGLPPTASCDVLCSMAGNGWSAWHYLPLMISFFSAVPWKQVLEDDAALREEMQAKLDESEESEDSTEKDDEVARLSDDD